MCEVCGGGGKLHFIALDSNVTVLLMLSVVLLSQTQLEVKSVNLTKDVQTEKVRDGSFC